MNYLMSIDGGTGSVRVSVFDTNGNQVAMSQREWFHKEDDLYKGSMDFDVDGNWIIIKTIINDCLKKSKIDPKDIIGLSTTTMREGFVLYDKNKKELFACANVDARASEEVRQLSNISCDFEKNIYSKSGQAFALGALARLLWVKNNKPQVYEKVAYINMLNDWIVFKLTNEITSDPSNGCTSGMFGLKSRVWEKEILEMCGLKTDIFPPVREGGEVIGNICIDASKETGLSQNTKVVVGGGDCQVGSIGVGVTKANQCAVFGGSFWQSVINTNIPIIDDSCKVRINCHAVKNLWQYEALAFYPGIVLRWYKNAFCNEEVSLEKQTGKDAYLYLDVKAEAIPIGSYGIIPIFSDIMNFTNWKHAAPSFLNLNLNENTCNKYTLYRSLLENAALVTYGNIQLIKNFSNLLIDEVTFASGASKSPLWSQIVCDCLGIPLKVPVEKEASSLGTAMCAGVGGNIFSSFEEASEQCVKFEKTYEPNLKNHEVYKNLFETWRTSYSSQLDLANRGVTTHMWKAPGL